MDYETGTTSVTGYATYKTTTRSPALFVSSNDGFLHAFNPTAEVEMWGYAPPPLLPLLTNLADTQYVSANRHLNLIDATPVVGDVYDDASSTCKFILVSGFETGVKGYYALDVSNPNSPKSLWNFYTDSSVCNVTDGGLGNALENRFSPK
jgi:type IV pilus assembly protein PilY1